MKRIDLLIQLVWKQGALPAGLSETYEGRVIYCPWGLMQQAANIPPRWLPPFAANNRVLDRFGATEEEVWQIIYLNDHTQRSLTPEERATAFINAHLPTLGFAPFAGPHCGIRSGNNYSCDRNSGHEGPHIALRMTTTPSAHVILDIWDNTKEEVTVTETPKMDDTVTIIPAKKRKRIRYTLKWIIDVDPEDFADVLDTAETIQKMESEVVLADDEFTITTEFIEDDTA